MRLHFHCRYYDLGVVLFTGKALKHVQSGLCVHPSGGLAADRVKLVLWTGCKEERLEIDFVTHGV